MGSSSIKYVWPHNVNINQIDTKSLFFRLIIIHKLWGEKVKTQESKMKPRLTGDHMWRTWERQVSERDGSHVDWCPVVGGHSSVGGTEGAALWWRGQGDHTPCEGTEAPEIEPHVCVVYNEGDYFTSIMNQRFRKLCTVHKNVLKVYFAATCLHTTVHSDSMTYIFIMLVDTGNKLVHVQLINNKYKKYEERKCHI